MENQRIPYEHKLYVKNTGQTWIAFNFKSPSWHITCVLRVFSPTGVRRMVGQQPESAPALPMSCWALSGQHDTTKSLSSTVILEVLPVLRVYFFFVFIQHAHFNPSNRTNIYLGRAPMGKVLKDGCFQMWGLSSPPACLKVMRQECSLVLNKSEEKLLFGM